MHLLTQSNVEVLAGLCFYVKLALETADLAATLRQHRGEYVLLIGSGVSRCSGIPTSSEIAEDLIRRLAHREGDMTPREPGQWFRERYGKAPDYPTVLDELTNSPEERSRLLRTYFEPSEDERRRGIKLPAEAHRSIARLVLRGYFRTVLTTNFDRVLEQALDEAGVDPEVICTPEGAGQLNGFEKNCTVIKLHGDYCGTNMKNTPEELEHYDHRFVALVRNTLADAGLLICGWSGEHDTALRRLISEYTGDLPAYWASSEQPGEDVNILSQKIRAKLIPIDDANDFFSELAARS